MRRPLLPAVAVSLALQACLTPPEPTSPSDTAAAADALQPQTQAIGARRLNRDEYDHTVRDLLATTQTPGRDLPTDDPTHGFDVVGDGLVMSPLHVELFEAAAGALAAEAADRPIDQPISLAATVDDLLGTTGTDRPTLGERGGWNLWSNGYVLWTLEVPVDGTYRFTFQATATQVPPDPAYYEVLVDEAYVVGGSTAAVYGETATSVDFGLTLTAGTHTLSVGFLNDYYDADEGLDRNLYVYDLALAGPDPFLVDPNPVHDAVMVCDPDPDDPLPCLRDSFAAFVPKAWRRPVTQAELDDVFSTVEAVVDAGDPWLWGLEFGVRRVLTSPHFLYLSTPATQGTDPAPLDDHTLASRLSYFLWSSMPDDTLRALADAGQLQDPAVLREQVQRMLVDPKAAALTDRFAGQWLMIRAVDDLFPDPWTFPDYDADLQTAMKEEMTAFFTSFVQQDRPMDELLTSEWGYANPRLAQHYNVQPSNLAGTQPYLASAVGRRGLLGQAGLQAALAYPTRTSPTLRGHWVLGSLLCDEPDPAPPNITPLEDAKSDEPTTLRDMLERHRTDPVCASCHANMDPIGLSLEHFDGIGAFRTEDNGLPIDATGTLDDGRSFEGLVELSDLIVADSRFEPCLVEKTMTYALGRSLDDTDEDAEALILQQFRDGGRTFAALATAIALSEPMRSTAAPTTDGAEE